jgi:hypothetical protein
MRRYVATVPGFHQTRISCCGTAGHAAAAPMGSQKMKEIPRYVRFFPLLTMILLAVNCVGSGVRAQNIGAAPQVWVTVTSVPVIQYPRWKGIRTDAPDQWKPDADWQTVASHTKVAKLIAGNIENTRDTDLQTTLADVERRHLELALEIGPLVRSADCAPKTESYGNPGETEAILQKIRRNGGDLRYVGMDEPFFYGHRDAGGCHLSAAELARQVAASVASMRRIFPELQVGDIEVAGADGEWITELAQWADAYREAVGEPLAFLHADVGWSELAMRNLVLLARELKGRHIPFGIIYNGDADVTSTLEWTQSAERHFVEIESVLNVHPDAAIFQTWTPYPTNVLPENQPGTLMNVAWKYLQPASSLHLTRSGADITGVLSRSDGEAVTNANVTFAAVDVGARMGPSPRHLAGTVPPGAVTGVIGIRVGMEGSCVCAGPTGAIVGGIHYKEQGSGKPQQDISPVSLPIQGAPASFRALEIIPGKTFAPNLKQFPVTAGKSYTLDTVISATTAAEHAGYVTLVFLDAEGKGLLREFLWFTPSTQTLGTAQTDDHGAFRLSIPEAVELAQAEIRAEYGGNASLRPAMGILSSPLGAVNASLPALESLVSPKATPLTILYPRTDFKAMFADAAPTASTKQQWDQVSRRIQMVYFSGGAITLMSDIALARMVRDLAARHIGLGLEVLATNWFHEPPCGQGIEGFIDPGSANSVVTKLLRAGATLDQIGMDEPLWFGHFYSGKNACRSSIPDLASRVAVIVKIYTAAFPHLAVGDIEPFPAVSNQPNWQSAYASWVKQFQVTAGTPLTFLDLDFDWAAPRLNSGPAHNTRDPAAIAALAKLTASTARQNGLLAGMILNGGGAPVAHSDAEWMQQARTHIRALQTSGVHFDHALFDSWDKFPIRTLPESDPNTLSSLIGFYGQP